MYGAAGTVQSAAQERRYEADPGIMRLTHADLGFASTHEQGARSLGRSAVQVRVDPPVRSAPPSPAVPEVGVRGDGVELSLNARDELRLRLLELLFGAKRQELRLRLDGSSGAEVAAVAERAQQARQAPPPPRLGWGAEITHQASYEEWESTALHASGNVSTSDGRTLALSFDYRLERYFRSESTMSVRVGDAPVSDPLVFDLAGTGIRFSVDTVGLDLDGDGRSEAVHRPQAGAAFLVRDGDGDGRITRGVELFGPQSGQGFAELAQLDQDGNGAIDEGDAAWSTLQLWDGAGGLTSLGAAGVGAILLPSTAAAFTHTDDANQALAHTRRLGIYLREDGSAGAVAQVDLVL
jgi:hypothetical protein